MYLILLLHEASILECMTLILLATGALTLKNQNIIDNDVHDSLLATGPGSLKPTFQSVTMQERKSQPLSYNYT